MKHLTKLAMTLAMLAAPGFAGKLAPTAKSTAPTPSETISNWQPIFIVRNGVVNPARKKDFNDQRFEYRWTSEWVAGQPVCSVELRNADDTDGRETIPTLGVVYSDLRGRGPAQPLLVHDVVIKGPEAHAYLKPTGCVTVDLVYWSK